MAFIEIQGLEKKYEMGQDAIPAVSGVNLKIGKGEFVSILGPSGSGKSTLLHLLGALDRPDGGIITVENFQISKMKDRAAARFRNRTIGFVFQTFNLLPNLTALENVMLPLTLNGIGGRKAKKIAATALDAVGLKERVNHRPPQLSGGELQRVSIARAVVNNPKIILADEPTGNLDSKTGKSIMKLFQGLNQKGHTIIVVTHNREHAKYANRIIEFLDGKIIDDTKRHNKK